MNNIDKQYLELVQDILDNGVKKQDRTGTGTLSVFGRQIRHKMSEGFPLLTTKKIAWKTMVTELLWFLRGDTNIKYLVDNNCHIWDGDAYKNYRKEYWNLSFLQDKIEYGFSFYNHDTDDYTFEELTQEEFINRIKTDDEFAEKWGDLGPIYGKQWRKWGLKPTFNSETGEIFIGNVWVDQIAEAIHKLKTNPDDRGIIVSAWNVGEIGQMVLRPCHNFFQFYTRELSVDERFEWYNKRNEKKIGRSYIEDEASYHLDLNNLEIPTRAISLSWNQRSADTGLGLPFNIASYALLLEIIAKIVNMVPDELIGNLGDTHLYLNHIEPIKEQLGRESFELPKLKIQKTGEFWKGFDVSQFGHLDPSDFMIEDYQSHPTIKLPLSN